MKSYYQKGIPLSFDKAVAKLTIDDIVFSPFPAKLGVDDTTFPADGSLKELLGVKSVWPILARTPMEAWRKLVEHIGKLDTQNLLAKAIGRETYGTILRSSAHRIRIHIWTETRSDAYTYDAFLTNDESLQFNKTSDDIVRRYEMVAKRNLAAREGFSSKGFGDDAFKMLRIKKVTSSVLDRHGNQVWPEDIPKWRLDRTPSNR